MKKTEARFLSSEVSLGKYKTDEHGRLFFFSENLDSSEDSKTIDHGDTPFETTRDNANLVSSLCQGGKHKPVIDIDFPVRLVESSTPGHFHFYIDVEMTWDQQCKLMLAMEEAGIVQRGFREFSEKRGMSFVRPEWVRKDESCF